MGGTGPGSGSVGLGSSGGKDIASSIDEDATALDSQEFARSRLIDPRQGPENTSRLATVPISAHCYRMTIKHTVAAVLLLSAFASPAFAACPAPTATEDTPEHLAQQRERLVCLQNEIARTSEDRQRDFEIEAIGRSVDQIQLQRKFDALNFEPPEL